MPEGRKKSCNIIDKMIGLGLFDDVSALFIDSDSSNVLSKNARAIFVQILAILHMYIPRISLALPRAIHRQHYLGLFLILI